MKTLNIEKYTSYIKFLNCLITFGLLSIATYKVANFSLIENFAFAKSNLIGFIENLDFKDLFGNEKQPQDIQKKFQQEVFDDRKTSQKLVLEDRLNDENKAFFYKAAKSLFFVGAVAVTVYVLYLGYTKGSGDDGVAGLFLEYNNLVIVPPLEANYPLESMVTNSQASAELLIPEGRTRVTAEAAANNIVVLSRGIEPVAGAE